MCRVALHVKLCRAQDDAGVTMQSAAEVSRSMLNMPCSQILRCNKHPQNQIRMHGVPGQQHSACIYLLQLACVVSLIESDVGL